MITHPLYACAILLISIVAQSASGEPVVEYLFPAGGQAGSTVEVIVGGKAPTWPVNIWVSHPGLVVSAIDSAADQTRRLSITIPAETQPDVYWLRLYDDSGAAAPRPFVVSALPEAAEQEPNDQLQQATQPPLANGDDGHSIVCNGQLQAAGDVDLYAISVKKGQTLVADLDAHRPLGSAVDTVMQIVSPAGFVLAQNDDQHSLDPRLAFDVPHDGIWYIRLFGFPATPTSRIRFAGDAAYVYRLTLTTGPTVEYALPLAAQTEGETRVRLFGWNLQPSQRELTVGPDSSGYDVRLQPAGIARTIRIPFVPHPVIVESDLNPEFILVDPPTTVTGRISEAGDHDVYEIDAKEGGSFTATLESRSLGYPLDAVLILRDSDGSQLARVDDTAGSRDATLEYQSKQAGRLRLEVHDLHGHGGNNFVYRLSIRPLTPDFGLSLNQHQVKLSGDGTAEIPVTISRLGGHKEAIAIQATGLPDGVTATAVISKPESDSAKEVKLQLRAAADAPAASVPIRIGAVVDSPKFARIATSPVAAKPMIDLWLTVTEKPSN